MRSELLDPLALAASARALVRSIDPGIAVLNVATLEQSLAGHLAPRTLLTRTIVLFSALAALLAAVGVYSVMSYVVGQRTREFGIRIALGAGYRDIVRLVLDKGVRPSVAGVAVGLGIAAGTSRLFASQLFGVSPVSPTIYAAVASLALVAAVAACSVPAWRASRVDSLAALRAD
jgi:putative ABC transport system permease protein